jgi:hypothetical protein
MSQERPRKIPINNRVVDLLPTACTALAALSRVPGRGSCPLSGWLILTVSMYAFARRDVRHVHHHLIRAMHVEHLAAGTLHEAVARLARSIAGRFKPLASIPQRIFSGGPISLIAPCLKIGLGAVRQEHLPCGPEICAGLLQGRGGVGLMSPRMRARIETAAPFPRIGVVRISDALGNRPDVNIAVIDVPAVMTVVCGSAAGKLGHAGIEARDAAQGKPRRDSAPVVPLFGVGRHALAPGAGRTGGALRPTPQAVNGLMTSARDY